MKKQKLHIFPLETPFLRRIQTGVQYFNQKHFTNFNESSLEIRTFNSSPRNENWPTDSIFEKILNTLSLHNAKYLTKLDISIQGSSLFKTSTLRKLGLILAQNFKTLKQVDLRFLNCRKLNGGNLGYLLDSLTKGMGHLTEVNLSFIGCTDIDDQCMRDLKLLILKRCKRLTIFKVIISGEVFDLSGQGFVYFEPDLDQRRRNNSTIPESGSLRWPNKIIDEGGASLCRSIARYQKKLRSLTFTMQTLQRGTDLRLTKSLYKMLTGLPNLENLNFCSSDSLKIDDEYLEQLTFCLGKSLKNLKSLSLDFPYRNEITERGYEKFANNFFSRLPSQLTFFALNLDNCNTITDDIIREIGFNIAKNLKNLQTLILSFHEDENSLTVRAPLELTQVISKDLPSLKKLVLSFRWCEGIDQSFSIVLPEQIQQFDLYLYNPQYLVDQTWKGLNRLSLSSDECVEKKDFMELFSDPNFTWKNLNQLKLVYAQSQKIKNQAMRELASAIGTNLENLTSLELGFSYCYFLTSESLILLGDKILRRLKKLRHLHLNFYAAAEERKVKNSFSEGGLLYLASVIASKLENLESLTLFFYHTMDEETNLEEVVDEFCSIISRKVKKLKKLALALDFYQNPELKHRIREKLCHIPILEIH